VQLVNYVVVIALSTRPLLSFALALCFPIIGLGGIKLAERNSKFVIPQTLLILALHLVNMSVCGPRSPAWLYTIGSIAASIFIIRQMRLKIVFLISHVLAAALGNYLSGKDYLTIMSVTIALGIFGALILRAYQFLHKINDRLEAKNVEIESERAKSESLLLNILPTTIADELKSSGSTQPVHFDSASVLFTDFVGFTNVAEKFSAKELVAELDRCFSYFDSLMQRYKLEKLKTIGDSYMCAGGLPSPNRTHAIDCVLAALEIQAFMNQLKEIKDKQGEPYWELRVGIHTGPLVAGVIGEKKFQYDVWGDTVNTASRMESSGVPGKVNISSATETLVGNFFEIESRGRIAAKNKGEIEMYFVTGLRPEFSQHGQGRVPNDRFQKAYEDLQRVLSA